MTKGTEKSGNMPMRRVFPKGTTIFKEGEHADQAYILESGRVEIFKMVGGRRIRLGVIGLRGIFGELALIDDGRRMAAAFAAEDSVCLVVTREAIGHMLDGAPQGLTVLIQSMVGTIRSAGEDLAEARFQLMEQAQAS